MYFIDHELNALNKITRHSTIHENESLTFIY